MSAKLAAFLRNIPQSNQTALPLEQLIQDENIDILRGYVLMLETLGVVKSNGNNCIQARSQTAKYLLESLASFVESGEQVIGDWNTRGVYRDSERGPFQNAATFLYELEKRRIAVLDSPLPSRNEEVAQVLIKRTNPKTGKAEFLLQYDVNAGQFQLIGGRRKLSDANLEETIIREIEEELEDDLRFRQHYELIPIAKNLSPEPSLSPTFGALSRYHFWIFHMRGLSQPLQLQPDDQWVPIEDVLQGRVIKKNGDTIKSANDAIYKLIDEVIDGGLANLEDSFSI